ncbi:MAG: DEAD/DEAH box helicase, partial [Lachnospiraceae bacterium]|nr:DEAD/DEAH box helicase [Lachnospiraceae bacterium]
EDTFPYEETESQIAAIEEVKKDMESVKIMDRLICGDVGFGKTEVALRAAMKAVIDGKQVVYLCPTTILAEQHYNTFRERMEPFAVSVSMMSRFRTDAENKKTAKELSDGTCDVVIGTHRVLSKDVSFKNLGLLIIDEEQRFGVRHKETIKKLRRNVDVLSLSATPIPRTLHMSLVGIRDMSLLSEAPEERLPIQTFVMERSPEIVREAIERELSRGGQVYYVINRIRDIADVADKIKELVPNASVEYAHGRMPETVLENIMSDFINRRIDVLVSTTIIEIGLDISNVNTIIIHDSDRLGLSQLYQLRGRVGRSNRTAYAFLMYTKDKMLKEVAEKRLSAIREFTELGSGFKVAMRDLEIRGAGNLLGEAQSGHMAAVGYDLYVKMLSEAVAMEKGEGEASYFDTSIDLSVDAFIPDNYIKDSGQKLEAYKRIAGIRSEDDKSEVVDELIDRFGDIPGEVMMLMDIAILRTRAHEAYVTSLKQIGKVFRFILYEKAALDVARIPELLEKNAPYLSFEPDPKKPALEFDAGKNNRLSKEDIDAVPWKIVDELVELKV